MRMSLALDGAGPSIGLLRSPKITGGYHDTLVVTATALGAVLPCVWQ